MIKYKLVSWLNKVIQKEVDTETKHFVFLIDGRKEAKSASYHTYFDTWDEAYTYLLKRTEQKVRYAQKTLYQYEEERELVRAIQKDEVFLKAEEQQ